MGKRSVGKMANSTYTSDFHDLSSAQKEIYQLVTISKIVPINILHVGRNQSTLSDKLESIIASDIEGKCIVQGFVQPNSVKVSYFSAGVVQAAKVVFEVTFTCNVCKPEINDILRCVAKNVTKAGIRAEVRDYHHHSKNGRVISPVVIFVARDQFGGNEDDFEHIREGQTIQVQVVGLRFELYDKYISVIAKLYHDSAADKMDTSVMMEIL